MSEKKFMGKNLIASISGVTEKLNFKKVDSLNEKRVPKVIDKELDLVKDEFSKMCMVLGIETLELYKKNELSFDTLETYLVKASDLQNQIAELVDEKERYIKSNSKFIFCTCGEQLSKSAKFCPECGSEVDNGLVTCSCGQEHNSDVKFCKECGDNIQLLFNQKNIPLLELEESTTCVCGAVIPSEQKFCFECGRVVED